MSNSRKTSTRRRETRTFRGGTISAERDCFPVGVVGLGLMGTSIATCLLAAGHPVVGVEHDPRKRSSARRRAMAYLKVMRTEGLLRGNVRRRLGQFAVTGDYAALADARLVIESIVEDVRSKRECLREIEDCVSPDTIIGSNTSAIPPSLLQEGAKHPDRILGMHWAEPAHTTRFMEIICGDRTDKKFAERARKLAEGWGKEPSILRREIRGFITNRCMYALLREAFHLVEAGYATVEDVDRSLRNDFGYWMTFAGPFRFMDLTGIPAYATVMRDLFPELDCCKEVPALMRQMVDSGAQGVSNSKGFYHYTPAQAKRWEKLFMRFSYEIRALAGKYPADAGDRVRNRDGLRRYTTCSSAGHLESVERECKRP